VRVESLYQSQYTSDCVSRANIDEKKDFGSGFVPLEHTRDHIEGLLVFPVIELLALMRLLWRPLEDLMLPAESRLLVLSRVVHGGSNDVPIHGVLHDAALPLRVDSLSETNGSVAWTLARIDMRVA
jgi:hypothetical protein